jgi:hypothetical protein
LLITSNHATEGNNGPHRPNPPTEVEDARGHF